MSEVAIDFADIDRHYRPNGLRFTSHEFVRSFDIERLVGVALVESVRKKLPRRPNNQAARMQKYCVTNMVNSLGQFNCPLRMMCIVSIPAMRIRALQKDLHSSIGWVTHAATEPNLLHINKPSVVTPNPAYGNPYNVSTFIPALRIEWSGTCYLNPLKKRLSVESLR
jgi:hypothetical protein